MDAFNRFRCSGPFKIFTLACAVFTDVFLYGVVVPVIPFSLHDRAGVPRDQSQNVVSILMFIFGASLLAGSPPAGLLEDKLQSRKAPFLIGLVGLFLAILFFWLAKSVVLLALARVVQGASTTMVWVACLSIIVDSFDQAKLGTPMSLLTLADVTGKVISPTIGGVLYHFAGYDAVFILALCLIVFDAILRLVMREKPYEKKLSDNEENGERDPLLASQRNGTASEEPRSSVSNSSTSLFSLLKRNKEQKPLDPSPYAIFWSLLKDAKLLTAVSAFALSQLVFISVDTILPLFIADQYGFTSLGVGISFIPVAAPALLSPLIGKLVDKIGPKWPCTIGFILGGVSFTGLAIIYFTGDSHPAYLYISLFIFGISHGFQETGILVEVSGRLEGLEEHHPVIKRCGKRRATSHAYSMVGCGAGTGLTFGPLISGLIVAKANFGWAWVANALLSLLGIVPAILSIGGSIWGQPSTNSS